VFAVALLGGVTGAYLGVRVVNDPEPPATATTTPRTPAPEPTEAERIRRAIDRALPAVVTVLADMPPRELETGQILEAQNIGSGVVVNEDGTVITNYHVIEGALDIAVVLATGERREARVLADDSPFQDLAVLQIPPGGLRSLPMGDAAPLRLGDRVIVVSGGLIDYQNQVKLGVVSSTNVDLPRNGFVLEGLIQTDAAVNHGDSGGALVDLDGRLVGLMTTIVRTQPGGRVIEGAAFAQPVNRLAPVIDAVVRTGVNPRGRIGIERPGEQHVLLTPELADELGAPVAQGAAVIAVVPGSPADEAGIVPGDIVLRVGNATIRSESPLVNILAAVPPGAALPLAILRDGNEMIVTVSPRPATPASQPPG
jgi:serine protease DegQ